MDRDAERDCPAYWCDLLHIPSRPPLHELSEVLTLYRLLIYEHSEASSRSTFQHTVTLVYLLEFKLYSINMFVFGFILNLYELV